MSTCHGQAQIQRAGKYTWPLWGLRKGVDAGKSKEFRPIMKQNTNEKTSIPATNDDITTLQQFTGQANNRIYTIAYI